MTMSSHLLRRAIALWNSGQKAQARRILEAIVYNDRGNESAWIWYIYSLESNQEKIAALERFLSNFPHHTTGRKALATLKTERAPQPESQVNALVGVPKTDPVERGPSLSPEERRPARKPLPSSIPWLLILSGLCIFLFSTVTLLSRYSSLQSDLRNLTASNQQILRNYEQLTADFETLKSEHVVLTNEYNSLTAQYNALNSEYAVLAGNYNSLYAEHTTLRNSYDSLLMDYNYTLQSYSQFREIAIAPPYIFTRGRTVHLVFERLDGSLLKWDIGSDWLEYHLRLGDDLRNELAYDLTLYNEYTGETYRTVDDRDFVDPTPFTNLMSDLYSRSPDEYTFIREVWYIVAQLTAYTSEIRETPRFPMETLLSGGGDCEDHAILFASMILASPVPWEVKFIYMDAEHPTRPQTMNHVIVQVVTSNGLISWKRPAKIP
ncbi:MAG TPA: hypothetical protein VFO91_03135 [Anaerolineales bacterium]|nr:hypothetical protein [Anaerolineales bacterium]